ncbi:MAG: ribosomal RNA small subunit methyltransferase A [Nitrospirota bacterium]|nr:ribosomal RNA small subunit methyltransferase A [Nitrospirota bacterium]MDE3036128.1 ribosomal RNA small subunit methyltransferase A [Nitrospirota bacterium]MDE3118752.1 ribosomal RNA small subunit methyltransferase A [Nitrospirota bacterium]MDE3226078.1 ribosomal RNA small subunit methyltransferase A [Nitrospirota bacterium]MDE3242926.1 ribosomal RNA small subunit methyltransferase A [Nitrospirota bacterium]
MMPVPPPARKRLGQHFLVDLNIVRKIVALAELHPDETVFEIGPGRGVLTRALCAEAKRVIAVELDVQLGEYLRETMRDCGHLELRSGDALEFPYEELPERTVVVANLPYYVSTPLLFKLFEARARIDRMVLMLQTEVARRLVARPGTEDYGILSVLTQYSAVAKLAFPVSANCFRPRPDVGSSVVSLVLRRRPDLAVHDEARFVRTVRASFAHRRKTLANSLLDEGLPQNHVRQALAQAGIEPKRRAETLTLQEFAILAEALSRPGAGPQPKADG